MTTTDRLSGLGGDVAFKPPVRVVTTANITLSALQTIGSVTLAAGDRVLVKDQTDQTANGIYIAATGNWTRAKDFNGNRDATRGTMVYSYEDAAVYELTTANDVTIGTDNITWARVDFPLVGTIDNDDWSGDPLSVANGGTAATTEAAAKSSLGTPYSSVEIITANETATVDDDGKLFLAQFTGSKIDFTLPLASTLTAGWTVFVKKADTQASTTAGTNSGYVEFVTQSTDVLESGDDYAVHIPQQIIGVEFDGTQFRFIYNSMMWPELPFYSHRTVTNADSPYSVSPLKDRGWMVRASASGGNITVNLPAADDCTDGYRGFNVFVLKVDTSSNTVTIDADGAETINSELNVVLRQYGDGVWLYCDSNEWFIVSEMRRPLTCRVHRGTANQTATSATSVKVNFTNGDFNDASLFDTSTNYRANLPEGRWRVTLQIGYGTNNLVDQQLLAATIKQDGTTDVAASQVVVSGTSQQHFAFTTTIVESDGSTYVEGYAFKGGAGDGVILGGTNQTFMEVELVEWLT